VVRAGAGTHREARAIKPVSRVLARELAVTALLLLGVSVVVFAILYLAPATLSTFCSRGSRHDRNSPWACASAGDPRTWYGQYAAWFGKMLQGNFATRSVRPAGAARARARRRLHAHPHARLGSRSRS